MNEHDSERIAGLLSVDGGGRAAEVEDADVVVLDARENEAGRLVLKARFFQSEEQALLRWKYSLSDDQLIS